MAEFRPGSIITTFTTKSSETVNVRYPKAEDLNELTEFINTLSAEHTFIRFSGEKISREEEQEFLEEILTKIEQQNAVQLLAVLDGKIIGNVGILRDTSNKRRSLHVGNLGISIAAAYRGKGVGKQLMQAALYEAEQNIPNLRMFKLSVYSPNTVAKKMYENFGFVQVGKIPKNILHRGEYVDEIIMIKEINSLEAPLAQ